MRRIRNNLCRWLGEYRLNERDLADMTGIPYDTVRKMASGYAETINLNYLALICDVLELEITDILYREPGEVPCPEGKLERILALRDKARNERRATAKKCGSQKADKTVDRRMSRKRMK